MLRRKFVVKTIANDFLKNIGVIKNPTGEYLYSCNYKSDEIRFVNVENGEKVTSFSTGKVIFYFFIYSLNLIVCIKLIMIWSLEDEMIRTQINEKYKLLKISMSPLSK